MVLNVLISSRLGTASTLHKFLALFFILSSFRTARFAAHVYFVYKLIFIFNSLLSFDLGPIRRFMAKHY